MPPLKSNQTKQNTMKTRLILASMLATCVPCSAALYTENFDSGLGTFNLSHNNTANGNNFGYTNTNYTAGTSGAGELSGVIARVDPSRAAYVATSSILSTAGAKTALQLSGEGNLQQNDFDGNFQVGYMDTQNSNSFIGLNVGEPGGDSGTAFRATIMIRTDGGSEFRSNTINVAAETPFTFNLSYNPATDTINGTIAGQAASLTAAGFGGDSMTFDAFGLISNHGPSTYNSSWADMQTGAETSFDALTYTVPETSSAMLSLLGVIALASRRSRRQA